MLRSGTSAGQCGISGSAAGPSRACATRPAAAAAVFAARTRHGRLRLCRAPAAGLHQHTHRLAPDLDDELSNRWIDLDPAGYFIIKLDRQNRQIVAEHFTNTINKNGLGALRGAEALLL